MFLGEGCEKLRTDSIQQYSKTDTSFLGCWLYSMQNVSPTRHSYPRITPSRMFPTPSPFTSNQFYGWRPKNSTIQNTPDLYPFVMINIALNAFRHIITVKFRKFTSHITPLGRLMDFPGTSRYDLIITKA